MKKHITNKKRLGFTLIEVVIVLAIGALIILVVLNAVGSARRNQRDSTRRSEASQIAAALEQYAANHDQQYPTDGNFSSFLTQYEDGLATKGWADQANCPSPVGASDYVVLYNPNTAGGNTLSYTMDVCLESENGAVNIQD